jgi:hypothetical protein
VSFLQGNLPIEVDSLMVSQVKPEELPTRVQTLQEELRASNKEAAALRAELALAKADSLASSFETVGPKNVRYFILDSCEAKWLGCAYMDELGGPFFLLS